MKELSTITVEDIVEYLRIILSENQIKIIEERDGDLKNSLMVEEGTKIATELIDLAKDNSDIGDALILIWFLNKKRYNILELIEKELV